MEWAIEAAKQVPALAVVVGLVVYFLKHLSELRQDSEQRIVMIMESHERRMREVVDREADVVKSFGVLITANNEALGSIRTLLMLVEGDLKHENRRVQRTKETG